MNKEDILTRFEKVNKDPTINKGKDTAEKIVSDVSKNVKEMQTEIEKRLGAYTGNKSHNIKIDLSQTEKNYYIKADLPGVNKEDIDIELNEYSVKITANFGKLIEPSHDEGEIKHFFTERNHGLIRRTIKLGKAINIQKADAKQNNGVLTIKLPKIEEQNINLIID